MFPNLSCSQTTRAFPGQSSPKAQTIGPQSHNNTLAKCDRATHLLFLFCGLRSRIYQGGEKNVNFGRLAFSSNDKVGLACCSSPQNKPTNRREQPLWLFHNLLPAMRYLTHDFSSTAVKWKRSASQRRAKPRQSPSTQARPDQRRYKAAWR